MPICETCGGVVRRDDVTFDEDRDRTTCPRCSGKGAVYDTDYAFVVTCTEKGLMVVGRAPGFELTYDGSWQDIRNLLRSRNTAPELVDQKLKLLE